MGEKVIDDYEEVFLERRTRRVRVTETRGGTVTAWHGGRRIANLGGWTSAGAAMRDARDQADRFSVGPGSSLSIRVCETVTRHWTHPDERDRSGRRDKVMGQRHVHDTVLGDLPAAEATVGFELRSWLGLPHGVDPAPYLPCYSDVAVAGITDGALYAGYGHGAVRASAAVVVPAEIEPPRPDRGDYYNRILIRGTLVVFVPPDGSAGTLLGGGIDLEIVHDWHPIRGIEDVRPAWQGDQGPNRLSYTDVPA